MFHCVSVILSQVSGMRPRLTRRVAPPAPRRFSALARTALRLDFETGCGCPEAIDSGPFVFRDADGCRLLPARSRCPRRLGGRPRLRWPRLLLQQRRSPQPSRPPSCPAARRPRRADRRGRPIDTGAPGGPFALALARAAVIDSSVPAGQRGARRCQRRGRWRRSLRRPRTPPRPVRRGARRHRARQRRRARPTRSREPWAAARPRRPHSSGWCS